MEYMRKARSINTANKNNVSKRFNLEAQVYEAYANNKISKEQCDDIFNILEEE